VPEIIGNYRLLRTLGGGGMGTVYEAEDRATGRHVALKLIAPQFAASRDTVERFRQEGRLASAIAHPRCVFVVAADEDQGRPYIVMELMPGSTLEDLVKQKGPLPPREAAARILDVIEGLEEAHRNGVIHRDVKPSNCFLDHDGRVKVGDFGLSKSLVSDQQLTKTGSFLGTVLYGSPEQLRREPLDQQTDIYSVASTLYFLLTGRAPFQTGDAMATIAQILSDPPKPPRQLRPDLPPALERVVLKGLERDRSRRYKTLDEFRQALLPFYHRQFAIGSMGWRLAAYVLDLCLLFVLSLLGAGVLASTLDINYLVLVMSPDELAMFNSDPSTRAAGWLCLSWWIIYFALFEGLFGFTPGKWLLRLRILNAEAEHRPNLGRVLVRTLVAYVVIHIGDIAALALTYFWNLSILAERPQVRDLDIADMREVMIAGLIWWLGWPAGVGILVSTMRTRNGQRGLHEFLSGTRVVRLPERRRHRSPWQVGTLTQTSLPLSQPDELPERIGPYTIQGALIWTPVNRVLVGEDVTLKRRVWLWLRPMTQPELPAARHAISRTSRLRWLMHGELDRWRWDALVAPTGRPLDELIAHQGPLTWLQTRPVLEQLGYELARACEEKSLPESLDLSQVWIQENGRVVLLDVPGADKQGGDASKAEESLETVEAASGEVQSLDLLEETAALTLEGKRRRPAELGRRLEAPLPRRPAEIIEALTQRESFTHPGEFVKALSSTSAYQDEVTPIRRLGHLTLLALFSVLWFTCCMPTSVLFMSPPTLTYVPNQALEMLEEQTGREIEKVTPGPLAAALWQPDPLVSLSGLGLYQHDETQLARYKRVIEPIRARRLAMQDDMTYVQRRLTVTFFEPLHEIMSISLEDQWRKELRSRDFRKVAADRIKDTPNIPSLAGAGVEYIAIGLLAFWPSLAILWAWLARGGFTYALAGIALLQRNGKPAARWRCLWRAILFWAPLTLLLALSIWHDHLFWAQWEYAGDRSAVRWLQYLSLIEWYAALGFLVGSLVLALLLPQRSLHDRLAGTYLVPR
jgi:hypothetical protein